MFHFQSGKLVTRMFQKIQDLIDDKDALVFVLIDEVGVFRRRTVSRGGAGLGGLWRCRRRQPVLVQPPKAVSCRPGPGASQALRAVSTRPAPTQLTTPSLCAHRWKA